MNIIVKTFKHFHKVNTHRWYVFYYSIKAGIPFRGLVHDLSKYSPTEFFESVKYYDGHKSPIHFARKDLGYSKKFINLLYNMMNINDSQRFDFKQVLDYITKEYNL